MVILGILRDKDPNQPQTACILKNLHLLSGNTLSNDVQDIASTESRCYMEWFSWVFGGAYRGENSRRFSHAFCR